ncbi:hypothetical protein HDU76_001523, partial [Blyttiomyces sp. JEL0837]
MMTISETEYSLTPDTYRRYLPLFKDPPTFSDVPPDWFDDLDADVVRKLEFEKKAEMLTVELRRYHKP